MKLLWKRSKGIIIFIGLVILAGVFYFGIFLPLDFSQDYRKVQGIENIVFQQNRDGQCYKRCFWGLRKTESPQTDHSDMSYESDASIYELSNFINTDNEIYQSIYSPDKGYILYCEIEHKGTGVTDDEYCYYRVYEIETDKIITIYQAYKEWYHLFWVD